MCIYTKEECFTTCKEIDKPKFLTKTKLTPINHLFLMFEMNSLVKFATTFDLVES